VRAEQDGVIKEVLAKPGQAVDARIIGGIRVIYLLSLAVRHGDFQSVGVGGEGIDN